MRADPQTSLQTQVSILGKDRGPTRGLRYIYTLPDEDSDDTLYFGLPVSQARSEMLTGITYELHTISPFRR